MKTVKAAELMLEVPGFFLVNSWSLIIGRRFSALSADEELEFGNVYVMFPMKRLNSVVTAKDVDVSLMAVKSKIFGGNVKISPKVAAPATLDDLPETEGVGLLSLPVGENLVSLPPPQPLG